MKRYNRILNFLKLEPVVFMHSILHKDVYTPAVMFYLLYKELRLAISLMHTVRPLLLYTSKFSLLRLAVKL